MAVATERPVVLRRTDPTSSNASFRNGAADSAARDGQAEQHTSVEIQGKRDGPVPPTKQLATRPAFQVLNDLSH